MTLKRDYSNQGKDHAAIFAVLVIILVGLVAAIFLYFSSYRTTNNPAQNTPISQPDIVAPNLPVAVVDCAAQIPVDTNPKTGIYKFSEMTGIADYYYRAELTEISLETRGKCDFVRASLLEHQTGTEVSLYIPVDMPSLGTSYNTMPQDLSRYAGKTLQLQARYALDTKSKNAGQIQKILGWQIQIVFDNY